MAIPSEVWEKFEEFNNSVLQLLEAGAKRLRTTAAAEEAEEEFTDLLVKRNGLETEIKNLLNLARNEEVANAFLDLMKKHGLRYPAAILLEERFKNNLTFWKVIAQKLLTVVFEPTADSDPMQSQDDS